MNKQLVGQIFLVIWFLVFWHSDAAACRSKSTDTRKFCLQIHHTWLDEVYVLTKNSVGFSAPVSGRAYAYFSVGMYESSVELLPELQSLTGQLNSFKRKTWLKEENSIHWPLVVNEVDYILLNYFYRNMPPSNKARIEKVYDSIRKRASYHVSRKKANASKAYAESLAFEIINWSKSDGGDLGFENNFPEDYVPVKCASCWSKTFPGYLPALLPYWGKNRRMLKESEIPTADCQPFEFSIEKSSFMYQQAKKVLDNSKKTDPKFELIAEYWDDGAGYSGTPTGHFYEITKQLVVRENLELDDALVLYVKLGVAVNDAFISAFHLKYTYNFIRPITYIHKNIDPQFNTRIASPPFPEFPSGHSFQSGAATEVMKSILTDSISFTDSTHVSRTDINGSPRYYSSLTELSNEVSNSRMYGGIHFQATLDESLTFGRSIGQYVSRQLKCRL